MSILKIATIAGLALLAAACTTNLSSDYYDTSALSSQRGKEGTVLGFRQVKVAQEEGAVGTVAGGAAGAILGSNIGGGGTSNALGAIAGAVVGGIVGNKAQQALTSQQAWEITVRTNDGQIISVVQSDLSFGVCDNVIVYETGRGGSDQARRGRVVRHPSGGTNASCLQDPIVQSAAAEEVEEANEIQPA